MALTLANSPNLLLKAALVLGAATIAGAWFFEIVIGLAPCPMCLTQRWPYYIGLPIMAYTLFTLNSSNKNIALTLTLLLALLFLGSAGFAAFHSGVEWHLWEGPSECSGAPDLSASVGNLLQDLNKAKVVSCVDAAWRLFGISLAGYNVIISAIISALCFSAFNKLRKA